MKPPTVSRRYSSCLSLASCVSCPASLDLLSHCGGRKSQASDRPYTGMEQPRITRIARKKKKKCIITSQFNINHYRNKRKGTACRNLQDTQVFSDFLPPPRGLTGLRSSVCTSIVNNLHICWVGFPAIDKHQVD